MIRNAGIQNLPSLMLETPGCWACEEIGALLAGVFCGVLFCMLGGFFCFFFFFPSSISCFLAEGKKEKG